MKVLTRLTNKRSVRVVSLMVLLVAAFIAGMISKDVIVSELYATGGTTLSGYFTIRGGDFEGTIDGKFTKIFIDRPIDIPGTFSSCQEVEWNVGKGFVCSKVDCVCCP